MQHLPLTQFCGACGERLLRAEKVVVLLDNTDRTRFSGKLVPAFEFSRSSSLTPVGFLRICPQSSTRGLRCRQQHPISGVTLHQSCVEIFLAEPEWGDIRTGGLESLGEAAQPGASAREKRATLLDELWTVASCRTPWAGAAELYLREAQVEKYGTLELDAVARVASMLGLPSLSSLPAELLLMIWRLSEPSLLWRAITVHLLRLDVEAKRGKLEHNRSELVSLANVVLWERNLCPLQLVKTAERDALPPFVKITLDRIGILRIERQAERLPYVFRIPEQASARACILEDVRQRRSHDGEVAADAAGDVEVTMVQLKCGRVRLQTPTPGVFSIWDYKDPPDIKSFTFMSLRGASVVTNRPATTGESQMVACDLSKCFGVTILYRNEEIKGMRFHKDIDDCFDRRASVVSPAVKSGYFWAFLPIGPKDCVTAVWIHSELPHTLVFRLKLAGDVVIGITGPSRPATKLLAHGQRISLAYRVPPHNASIQFLGASSSVLGDNEHGITDRTCGSSTEKPPSDPRIEETPSGPSASFYGSENGYVYRHNRKLYFSQASLANVERIRAYSNPRLGNCRGLVLFYRDGAMRALGQCRVGTDTAEDFEGPTSICYRIVPYGELPTQRRNLEVNGIFFSASCREVEHANQTVAHDHDGEGWICRPLGSGTLQFFVSIRKSYYMQCKD